MDEKYRHLVIDGYDFEFGTYFSEGWELFKKGAGSFIGYFILMVICIYAVMIALSLIVNPILFAGVVTDSMDFESPGVWGGLIGYMFVQNAAVTIAQWCLIGGFYIFARNLINRKDDFGQFFGGFSRFKSVAKFYFIWLLILLPLIVVMIMTILPMELIYTVMSGDVNDIQYMMEDFMMSMLARLPLFFLLYFILLAVYILYSLTLPLIMDANMDAWQAMETSRRVVSKKFIGFFGLYLVAGLMMMIGGVITCFLGLLVLFPYVMCIQFVAYDRIFKPHEAVVSDKIQEFGLADNDANTEAEES